MTYQHVRFLDGLMRDWSMWARDGFASPGMWTTSTWPEGRPTKTHGGRRRARRRSDQEKLGLPHTEPHSTRPAGQSRVLDGKIEYKLELIHVVIVGLSDEQKLLVDCFYLRGMAFSDICKSYCVPSRYVGELRHSILKSIDNIV